ncbi:MAG TPA: NADH-quinone oxidoreductase subunit NuoN [Gammaproteobacteria bacterium]
MSFQIPAFAPALPEIIVLTMASAILVIDLYLPEERRSLSYALTQLTLVVAALATLGGMPAEPVLTFSGTFVRDAMGDILKAFIYLVAAGVFLYSKEYLRLRKLFTGEFHVIGLFGVLGMMVMVSAHSLLTVYLGLELLSLALYALVAYDRDSLPATEAAMKYFVLGALASGLLLYGMSMLYGASGTLDLALLGERLVAGSREPVLVFGLAFVVAGLAFKLGAVPFHMYLPDVYHGAPTAVTLYIGTAPKLAAFALVMRVLVEGLGGLHADWQQMLMVLAVLSLGLGNVVAIAQTNLKRMLAYSTISHVGFILLGILAATPDGYASSMFYAITYALMALGGFGMILLLSRQGFEADNLEDFRGLNERSPWFAFMMLLLMFSMAGVPPTVGFYAKLSVLQAVIEVDLLWLALVAVLFSVIGAFYYLRVIKLMYFDAPADTAALSGAADLRLVLSLNGLAILLLGLFPGSLMALCLGAMG